MPQSLDELYGIKGKVNPLTMQNPDDSMEQYLPRLTAPTALPSAPTAYSGESSSTENGRFTPPQSPLTNPKGKPNRLGDYLALADAATRGLDTYSTHRFLEDPQQNHEKYLPDAISHHVPAMAAYSEGIAGGNYLLGKELEKHGHPRLANLLKMADISVDAPAAIENLFLPTKAPTGGNLKSFKPNR